MPYKGDKNDNRNKKDFVRCNEQIRVPQVLLIENGQNVGVMSTSFALAKARAAGLDLVEVSATSRPPVCHIIDYGKFMFDKQKREKDKEKSNAKKEKEIAFHYVINDHDLQVKADQIKKFLEKDHKVRLVVKFKNREKAHKDMGFDTLNKLVQMISEVGTLEKPPTFEGMNIVARVQIKKGVKAE